MAKALVKSLFPEDSVVGRKIVEGYQKRLYHIEPSGSIYPTIGQSKMIKPHLNLPYEWQVFNIEITPDETRLLQLNAQTPIFFDVGTKQRLFEILTKSGFDGDVSGSYRVNLLDAVHCAYNHPSRRFRFYTVDEKPSLSLAFPEKTNLHEKHEAYNFLKAVVKVEKERDRTSLGKREFAFLDTVYEYSIQRKKELSKLMLEKMNKTLELGVSNLTRFAIEFAESVFIGRYVPKELRTKEIKEAIEKVMGVVNSIERVDYRAQLKKEAESLKGHLGETAKKLYDGVSNEALGRKSFLDATNSLCFLEEIEYGIGIT